MSRPNAPTDDLVVGRDGVTRCWWCGDDSLYAAYHDREWGRPTADDRYLFEKLCLEGFQAGLSWLTILRKRENFRRAFASFDPQAVARFDASVVDRLMGDRGIIRHKGKVESAINNARRYLKLVEECGSLAAYVWSYEPSRELHPVPPNRAALRARTTCPEAVEMSRDLKRRGWTFVGPTTVYAFMQAVGLVNDHLSGCHVREAVESERSRFKRPAVVT